MSQPLPSTIVIAGIDLQSDDDADVEVEVLYPGLHAVEAVAPAEPALPDPEAYEPKPALMHALCAKLLWYVPAVHDRHAV